METHEIEPLNIRFGIRPEKISIETLVSHFLETVDAVDMIDGANEGREAAMDTKDLLIDQSGDAHGIEYVHHVLPGVGVSVLLHALIIETVDLSDLSSFVVTAQQHNSIRVTSLQREKQLHCFYTEVTTVDVISHEYVFGVRNITSNTEQLLQIIELAVNVTAHCARCGYRLNVMTI